MQHEPHLKVDIRLVIDNTHAATDVHLGRILITSRALAILMFMALLSTVSVIMHAKDIWAALCNDIVAHHAALLMCGVILSYIVAVVLERII